MILIYPFAIFLVLFSIFLFIYFIENKSFKAIRPLKSQIINSSEDTSVKIIFYEQMKLNEDFKNQLKLYKTSEYDKDVINYAYTYASKTLNQELRDLIACTGDYSSRLNKTFMLEYKKTSGLKRQELLDKVENSKRFVPGEGYTPNKPNTKSKKSYDTNQIDVLIMNIKVKSDLLDSVISKSLYLNALTLREKYGLALKVETKVKIEDQLQDIESFLDRDIAIVSENKDKLIVNDLAINSIYLRDLETSWNQE